MGELIFVLVIVIQGIAGVAAAINKKKRTREAALKAAKGGADANASVQKDGSRKFIGSSPSSSNPMTARLDKARAARAKKKSATDTTPRQTLAATTPKPAATAPNAPAVAAESPPASASTEQGGSFDARLARRRQQIAQLRAMARGELPGIASASPAPPPKVASPTTPVQGTPAGTQVARVPAGRVSPAVPVPPQVGTPTTTSRTRSRAAAAGEDFTPIRGARDGKKARGIRRRRTIGHLLGSRSDLKRAIIVKELLDAPVSLRRDFDTTP